MVLSPMLTQFSPVQIVKVQCSPNSHQLKLLKSNAHPIFITSNGSKCNAHSILINSKYSSQTLTQFSPPTIGWCAILSQFSPDQKPTLQFSPNSHLCSQYSCNSHQLEMAGANAHLMLIYNFHQIGENWLRIEWELKFFFAWASRQLHDPDCYTVSIHCTYLFTETTSRSWLFHSLNPLQVYWSRQPRVFQCLVVVVVVILFPTEYNNTIECAWLT